MELASQTRIRFTPRLKLIEHPLKVLERVVEVMIRDIVDLDSMQFGFCPGRGTTYAIFILRQMQEKYLAKNKQEGGQANTNSG